MPEQVANGLYVRRYKKRFSSGSETGRRQAQWRAEFKLKCLWTEHELAEMWLRRRVNKYDAKNARVILPTSVK